MEATLLGKSMAGDESQHPTITDTAVAARTLRFQTLHTQDPNNNSKMGFNLQENPSDEILLN